MGRRSINIGDKAILTVGWAKFTLNHPEMYQHPATGELVGDWDLDFQLSMLILIGGVVEATIIGLGYNCYRLKYGCRQFGYAESYFEYRRDFILK